MESGLVVQTFGGVRLRIDGLEIARPDARSAEALLVYLASEERAVARDALTALLWPDRSKTAARAALRSALHRLRVLIGAHVQADRDRIGLVGAVQTDAAAFERRLREGRTTEALEAYRGPFLEGFTLEGAPAFEAWQETERARFEHLAIAAHQDLLARAVAHGDDASATRHARDLLAIDPLHEPTHRSLVRLLARAGRTQAARAHYEAFRTRLHEELDATPDPSTLSLVEAIEAGDVGSGTDTVAGFGDRPTDGIPPRSHGTDALSLPLVGRDATVVQIVRLLAQRDCRWVSVTGPGGVGKTRLALAVAATLGRSLAGGAVVVPLAGVRSPAFVLPTLAYHLGLVVPPGGDLEAQVVASLNAKGTLVVLDNLEHLLEAVPQLAAITRRAPRVKVLATSRIRLHISEEWLVPLEGLDVDGASTLFAGHAKRVDPLFDPEGSRPIVETICRQVGGVPLAIELAATWANALSVEEIATSVTRGLDLLQAPRSDLPPRHRSIAEMLEGSWRLLPDDLRDAVARLAIFRGAFTAETASRVTGARIDTILALVDRSFVRGEGPGRFGMHPLTRMDAAARLAQRAEAAEITRRHLATFSERAEVGARAAFGPEPAAGIAPVIAEYDDVRAALEGALDAPADGRPAVRLLDHMAYVWRLTSAIDEARGWCARALARADLAPEDEALIRYHVGHFAWMAGDFGTAQRSLHESLALLHGGVGDHLLPPLWCSLGMTLWMQRDLTGAATALDTAIAAAERQGAAWWGAIAQGWKGKTAIARGDLEEAERRLGVALASFERIGSAWGTGLFLGTLAEVHLERGDARGARDRVDASIALLEGVGFTHALTNVYTMRARLAREEGDERSMRTFLEQAIASYRQLGDEASAATIELELEGPAAGA